jgi:NADH:ubiquinone oxidoreductase subunit 6 (subunit J)
LIEEEFDYFFAVFFLVAAGFLAAAVFFLEAAFFLAGIDLTSLPYFVFD